MLFKGWEADQKLFGNPGKNQWVRSDVTRPTNFTEGVLDTDFRFAIEPSTLAASADCCARW